MGDNTQLNAIAAALGWPFETKHLVYRQVEPLLRFLSLPSLAGVDLPRSSHLTESWPDLLLCAGRGAEAVSFWLKQKNSALRTVFVGTPWADPARFDLVIASAQYGLSPAPNVLNTALPLHDVTMGRIEMAARQWQERLGHLPRPRIAILVGGSSGPYLFTAQSAERLGREASKLATQGGGSLLVTTSPRTPPAVAQALAKTITAPHVFHHWTREAAENPFHAFLGLADEIVVTADSISMLSEAVATGKPVRMFDIEEGSQSMRAEQQQGAAEVLPPIYWRGRTLDATMFRLLMNYAPARWSRDLRIVHRQLLASGRVSWLGDARPQVGEPALPDLERATSRIRALFGI
jgi:mitochondrial fission protein ELM1